MIERIPITNELQWLELRKPFFNASHIAALFGAHPFTTVAQIVAEKRGLLPPQEDTTLLRRGRKLESVAASEAKEQRKDWTIFKANELLCDRELRLAATPDYYIDRFSDQKRGVLELKVVSSGVFARDWDEMIPPLHVLLQLQAQMLLDNSDFGAIGALIIGEHEFDCRVYEVPRHAPTEQKILDAVKRFWADFDAGRAPEFDFIKDKAAIRALYPAHLAGKHVEMSHDNRLYELLQQRQQLVDENKAVGDQLEAVNNEIISKIGDAETISCGAWHVSYRLQHRKEYVVHATSYRVLRPKEVISGG